MSAKNLKVIFRGGEGYHVFKKGELHKHRKKTVGLWEPERENGPRGVYIRCLECLRILLVPYDSISYEGFSSPCVVCGGGDEVDDDGNPTDGCSSHMWIYFKGWGDND